MIEVIATKDFYVGGSRTSVIRKGDKRMIELDTDGNFTTITNPSTGERFGIFFGWCRIDDGWVISEQQPVH